MTNPNQFRFEECVATNAAGNKCTIPAGSYAVTRNSISVRVKIGGRELDLSIAEFARLQAEGKVSTT